MRLIVLLFALVGCRSTPNYYEILEVTDGTKPRFDGGGNQQAFANVAQSHRRFRASVEKDPVVLHRGR